MTISWFCEWRAFGGATSQLDLPDQRALVSLLSECPGLTEGHVMIPASAHDPYYPTMSDSPRLVLQLKFAALHALENGLKKNGHPARPGSCGFLARPAEYAIYALR